MKKVFYAVVVCNIVWGSIAAKAYEAVHRTVVWGSHLFS